MTTDISKLKLQIAKLQLERDRYKKEAVDGFTALKLIDALFPSELTLDTEKVYDDGGMLIGKIEVYNGTRLTKHSEGWNMLNRRITEQVAVLTGRPESEVDVHHDYTYTIRNRGARMCPDCGKNTMLFLHHVNFNVSKGSKYSTKWHQGTWYISCGCGDNAGEHYATPFQALVGWNAYIEHEEKMRKRKAKKEAQQKKLDAYLKAQEERIPARGKRQA